MSTHHIHQARAYLAQVRAFRSRRVGRFHLILLEWAGAARRRAAASVRQCDLFGA